MVLTIHLLKIVLFFPEPLLMKSPPPVNGSSDVVIGVKFAEFLPSPNEIFLDFA